MITRAATMALCTALLGAPPGAAAGEAEQAFRKTLELLKQGAQSKGLSEEQIYRGAIDGMLKAAVDRELAAYNQVLSTDELREIQISTSGKLAGIGIVITVGLDAGPPGEGQRVISRQAPLSVLEAFEGAPARKAGVLPGDYLLSIDGDTTEGMAFGEAVARLRGPEGSRVRLVVLRGAETRTLEATRAAVVFPTIQRATLPGGIGYLAIRSFSEHSAAEVEPVLVDLKRKAVRGLILDLRDNGGGAIEGVLRIAERLVPPGNPIVTIETRGEAQIHRGREQTQGALPIVVVVNQETASGAEMLARALRENGLALVVGEPTYGKSSVERIAEVGAGIAIKYTVARWRSPAPGTERRLVPDVPAALDLNTWARLKHLQDMDTRLAQDSPLRIAHQTLLFRLK